MFFGFFGFFFVRGVFENYICCMVKYIQIFIIVQKLLTIEPLYSLNDNKIKTENFIWNLGTTFLVFLQNRGGDAMRVRINKVLFHLGLQIEGFFICNFLIFFIKTDFHLEILQFFFLED
jgi:hypothetical protein